MFPRLICFLAVCLLTAVALADVPETITVQGRILDDTGSPPTATYFIHFRIFNQEVGGTELWPLTGPSGEGHSAWVENGLWTLEVGSNSPLTHAVFEADERWLEVEVGDGGAHPMEVMGRIRLNTSPYSYRVATVDSATGGRVEGDVNASSFTAGSETEDGTVWIFQNGATKPVITMRSHSGGHGGEIDLFDEDAYNFAYLETDIDGEGGFFNVYGDQSNTTYLRLDGNNGGSGSPAFSIVGSGSSLYFTSANTGTASLALPIDAVSRNEIFDEPGVASYRRNLSQALSGTGYDVLATRTITTPNAGYVLVTAHCRTALVHSNGTATSAVIGLSDVTTGLADNQDVDVGVPSAAPTGSYYMPTGLTALFSTGMGGTYTYYLLGNESSGNVTVADIQLNLLYVPTAYGTVDGTFAIEGVSYEDGPAVPGGLTAAEIEDEKLESRSFNRTRIERELADLEAELTLLKQQVQSQDAVQR